MYYITPKCGINAIKSCFCLYKILKPFGQATKIEKKSWCLNLLKTSYTVKTSKAWHLSSSIKPSKTPPLSWPYKPMCIYWPINTSQWACLHQFNSCSVQHVHLFRHKQDRICTANNEGKLEVINKYRQTFWRTHLNNHSLECFKPTIKKIRPIFRSRWSQMTLSFTHNDIFLSQATTSEQKLDGEFQSSQSEKHVHAKNVWERNSAILAT